MRKLLIATKNAGKFSEIKNILNDLSFECVSLVEIGVNDDYEETADNFKDNAVGKAKFYAEKTLLWTVADDSGLMIDVLDGEPGVKTRRWPGYEATDDELIDFTLEKLKSYPFEARTAKFVSIAALAIPRNGVYATQGTVKGLITEEPKGKSFPGLPFDQLFYYPEYKKTLAEVSMEMKQLVDHRGQAFKKLKRKIMTLLENEK